jgi:predicted DNA-binding transcriptional regulator YafY
MQARSRGVSLGDIQEEFEIGRRTAERMRDAAMRLFPQIHEVETNSKVKRWTLRNYSASTLVSFSAEELAELENLKRNYENDELQTKAELIGKILLKVQTLNRGVKTKVENELEILLEAENFAVRQHPRFKINKEALGTIRDAIMALKVVQIQYEKSKDEIQTYNVYPYGVIYGEKHFLVAFNPERDAIRLYNLSKIKEIKMINEYFDKDENFNLQKFSENSFGVYQEEPISVVLEFDKSVADDVKNFYFHPTQKIHDNDDGSVTVKFKASGKLSICWHLFKWGNTVKILKPASLKEVYKTLLNEAKDSLK